MAARITSIIGLQNLTNLVDFFADWNSLQTVNLSELTQLLNIDVSDQLSISTDNKSLTSVNLSGSTTIEVLRLDDSDFSAGAPDISALANLQLLDMSYCGLSGIIDLSMFPALTIIYLRGNEDITSVTLSEQYLDDVDFSENALTQESVDTTLMWLDGSGVENGNVNLINGTNASPSVEGIDTGNRLVNKGWDVQYNIPPLTVYTVSTLPTVGRDCELNNSFSLYAIESDLLEVTRFYTNGALTEIYLGDNTSFYAYAFSSDAVDIYTANISSTTGELSNKLICS
jgi:hypothetical protein